MRKPERGCVRPQQRGQRRLLRGALFAAFAAPKSLFDQADLTDATATHERRCGTDPQHRLEGTSFEDASFRGAVLDRADFAADSSQTNMTGADTTGAFAAATRYPLLAPLPGYPFGFDEQTRPVDGPSV